MQTLTVHVHDSVYQSLKALATKSNRSVEAELVEQAASNVLPASALPFWSEVWGLLNQRRAVLIGKKNREGLSADERVEYDKLQSISLQALEAAFPGPPIDEEAAAAEALSPVGTRGEIPG